MLSNKQNSAKSLSARRSYMVAVALAVAFLLGMAYMRSQAATVSAAPLLDLRFGYSQSDIAVFFSQFDDGGVDRLVAFWRFDYWYMLLYGAFYVTAIWQLSAQHDRKYRWLLLCAPATAVLCGATENTILEYMLNHGVTSGLAQAAQMATVIKFGAAYTSLALVIGLTAWNAYLSRQKRQ